MTDEPPLSVADPDRPESSSKQHAVRVLALLGVCGEDLSATDPAGFVLVMRSELRLQALDFWLRNPDYLAGELLTLIEDGTVDDSYVAVAAGLLDDPEPNLHYYPMPKWHYGAYEALDDAFSVLDSYGLADVRRVGTPKKRQRNQFFLTANGVRAAAELADDPVLSWYVRQADLVKLVAGDDNGTQLKARQYKQANYAETKLGLRIASIAPLVHVRLDALNAN